MMKDYQSPVPGSPSLQYTVTGHPVRMQGASYLPRSIQALQALSVWRNENAAAPDYWLREDICKAFKYLVGLKLGSTPAVEMLPITAEMWVEIVGEGMNEEQDRERVRVAFRQLFRTVKWWPQPADLLKILPRRVSPPSQPPPAGGRGESEEDHAAASARFQEILDSLK